ncbi:MAG: HD domain-containing protein [Myxococcales bacterium]|nr:HD domain-containing protein [Myxococcales bacterium]
MAVLLHRIRTVARIAGPARTAQLDALFRTRPWITRALLEASCPRLVAPALAELMDAIAVESAAHSRRLALGVELVAEALGWLEADRQQLVHSALMHDIGKLAVPDAVLDSPEVLSPEQLDLIQMHSSLGFSILSATAVTRPAAALALHHHEYFDGSGYHGTRGLDIPASARVFALVDAYDAMLRTDRVYRVGVGHDEARAELESLAGIKYEAAIVEAFTRIARGRWEAIWHDNPDTPSAVTPPVVVAA